MPKHFIKVLTIASILIASYVLAYPNTAFAVPTLSNSDAIKIIEEGRGQKYYIELHDGPAQIKNIKIPELFVRNGIITYSKSNKGDNWIDIIITGKGKNISYSTNGKGLYRWKLADLKVTKIVKNSEYKTPLANPEDELRIVMGLYKLNPTKLGQEYNAATGEVDDPEYKFRALLKYEPFREKFVYVTSDFGKLSKETFETSNIENYNFPLGYKKY